jgi:hypothetical protein
MFNLSHLPEPESIQNADFETIVQRQRIFGYTKEDLMMVMKPMVVGGEEAVGSMGSDVSLAILSGLPQLYRYFKCSLFAG